MQATGFELIYKKFQQQSFADWLFSEHNPYISICCQCPHQSNLLFHKRYFSPVLYQIWAIRLDWLCKKAFPWSCLYSVMFPNFDSSECIVQIFYLFQRNNYVALNHFLLIQLHRCHQRTQQSDIINIRCNPVCIQKKKQW